RDWQRRNHRCGQCQQRTNGDHIPSRKPPSVRVHRRAKWSVVHRPIKVNSTGDGSRACITDEQKRTMSISHVSLSECAEMLARGACNYVADSERGKRIILQEQQELCAITLAPCARIQSDQHASHRSLHVASNRLRPVSENLRSVA